ncbi:MAG: hypothetical protein P8X93_07615, partial [Gammaproteobacteria bacterium]
QIDAVFHPLFHATALIDSARHSAFLPISFANIRYYPGNGTAHYALVNKLNTGIKNLTADFTLIAADGKSILHLRQCVLKRLQLKQTEEINQLQTVQVLADRRSTNDKSPLPSLNHLFSGLENTPASKQLRARLTRYHEEVIPLLNALAISIARESLDSLGTVYEPFDVGTLVEHAEIDTRYQKLLESLCKLLVQFNKASSEHGMFQLIHSDADIDSKTIWRTLLADFPDQLSKARMIASQLLQIPDIISGKKEIAADIPSFDSNRSTDCLCDCQVHISLLQQVLDKVLSVWPGHQRRLKIAEFLDAQSTATRSITNLVQTDFCDYYYFVIDADQRAAIEEQTRHDKHIKVEYLDLNEFIIDEDFYRATFDIVIANNVLSRQRHINRLLALINQITATNGLLFITEAEVNPITEILQEFQVTMSEFDDPPVHPYNNSADDWQAMLSAMTGFQHNLILSDTIYPGSIRYSILAQRGAQQQTGLMDKRKIVNGKMLLIAAEGARSGHIARMIQRSLIAQGIQSDIMNTCHLQGCSETIIREVEHIVYLKALDLEPDLKL